MNKTELKVVRFNDSDVIATSGVLTLSGFGDSVSNNQTMTYNGSKVTSSSTAEEWTNMLAAASEPTLTKYTFTDGSQNRSLYANKAYPTIPNDSSTWAWFNGSYTYNKTSQKFELQQ